MRRILLGGIVLLLLLSSCNSIEALPVLPLPTPSVPATPQSLGAQPPEDKAWISPAKVEIGNFHLGAAAEWVLKVHNGKDSSSTYTVDYKTPNTSDGKYYVAPKDIVQDWVLIADSSPVIQGRETRDIPISIKMPDKLSEDQARFLFITLEGIKYLSDLRVSYFKLEYPSYLDKNIKKYVDKVNWSFVPKDLISSRTELIKYLESVGAPLKNFPELIDQVIYAMSYATQETNEAIEKRLSTESNTSLVYCIYNERSISNKALALRGLLNPTKQQEALTSKYIGSGNLVTDKWEFWLVVYDKSQEGLVTVEMASRWLVSMRA